MLVLKFKSFAKAWCRTWFVASLHPLCHNLVLGSMCSSLHVSFLMVGCLVLISYHCASYMLFALWFFSWHLFFFYLPCAMNSIYRVHSSFVVQSNVHRYKEFKNLYAQFEGEFILYVVIMRLTCLEVYFFLVSWSVCVSLPEGMPFCSSLQVTHV